MSAKSYFPRTALFLLTALNLLNYMDRSVLSAVQTQIQDEFHSSHAEIGLVTTAFFWVYMLAAPVMGPLADRFSRKWIVVSGAVLWSLATLLTAVTHDYGTLLFRHAIVGIGEASFGILAPTLVADLFPENQRGRILGIFYLAIPVGTALGLLAGGPLGQAYGWRVPFYVAGAPGLLLALAIAFLPEPPRGIQDSIPETPERRSVMGLLRNPAFWTATLGMAFMTYAIGGVALWMPTFLQRERGYSESYAGLVFGAILVFDGIVASLFGGWLGDKLLPRFKGAYYLISAFSVAIGAPTMLIALHAKGRPMWGAILVAGFLLLLNTSPLNAAIINSVGPHIRAFALAVNIFVIHLLGDAFSPVIIGRIADHSSLQVGLSSTAVALVLSAIALFYGMQFAPRMGANRDTAAVVT
ncbi:MAG TPA: MFS transporter [Terriglobales bacterium]|jgi:MFS family permease|nr:MFS transporter [Terriglobales bacterium]